MGTWRYWAGAALAIGVCATAATTTAQETKDDGPWLSRPTREELSAVRARAAAAGVPVRAVARCDVADDGWLSGCVAVDPGPPELGLGDALLDLGPRYRLKPEAIPPSRSRVLTLSWDPSDQDPKWLRRPSSAQFRAVFPVEAYAKGLSGRTTISCLLTEAGVLTKCIVTDETPAGSGFGAAAIAMVPQLKLSPARANGRPVASEVRIPLNFDMDWTSGPIRETRKRVIPASLTWAEAPDFAGVSAVIPPGKRGSVVLLCDLAQTGRLEDCEVARAEPKGEGLEAAAMALSARFMMPLSDAEKKAAASLRVQAPFTFDPARIDPARPVVEKPLWAATPSVAAQSAAFAALGGPVRVTLACRVQPGGGLGDCAATSEQPVGAGQAALSLAPAYRVSTWSNEGLPVVGGSVTVPIRYDPPKSAPQ